MADTMVGRAPVCPCDFSVSEATGTAQSNQVARFAVSVKSGSVTGFAQVAVFSFTVASTATAVSRAGVLYLYADCDVDPGEGSFIRMDDFGTYPLDTFLEIAHTNGAGPAYFLQTTIGSGNWFAKTGTPTTLSGALTIRLGTTTKYIPLYSSLA